MKKDMKKTAIIMLISALLIINIFCQSAEDCIDSLESDNVDKVLTGIECITENKYREGIPHIISLLDNKNDEILAQSIDALLILHASAPKEKVFELIDNEDASVRANAVKFLGTFIYEPALEKIVKALDDSSPAVRKAAAMTLSNFNPNIVIEPLLSHIDERVPDVRVEIVKTLSTFSDPRIREPLLDLLSDGDIEIVKGAVIGLGKLGDSSVSEPLIDLYYKTDNDQLINLVIQSLSKYARLSKPEVMEILIDAVETTDNEATLVSAIYGLGKKGNQEALSVLTNRLLEHSVDSVRLAAAESIGNIEDPSSLDALLTALDQEEEQDVKREVMIAIGKLRMEAAIEPLGDLLLNGDEWERVYAAYALKLLAKPRARDYLYEALDDESPTVRQYVYQGLQALGLPLSASSDNPLAEPGATGYDATRSEGTWGLFWTNLKEFYFVKSPFGQAVIYIISALFLISMFFILIMLINYKIVQKNHLFYLYKESAGEDQKRFTGFKNRFLKILPVKGYLWRLFFFIGGKSWFFYNQSPARRMIENVELKQKNNVPLPDEALLDLVYDHEETRFPLIFVKYATGTLTILGLTGTFWGLSELVVHFDKILSSIDTTDFITILDSMTQALGSMKNVLVGMQTAFSTSIWGLIGTLILTLTNFLYTRSHERFFSEFHKLSLLEIVPGYLKGKDCE